MALFEIELSGSSEKDLRKIDRKSIPRILEAIESLSENPFPVLSRKLTDTEASYRLKIGDYRLIYQVDTTKKVIIVSYIRHRKDAYKRL